MIMAAKKKTIIVRRGAKLNKKNAAMHAQDQHHACFRKNEIDGVV